MVAEFEADLIKARTPEGMAVARAAGKLRGRKPKLTPGREALMVDLLRTGQKNPSDLADRPPDRRSDPGSQAVR
jgi:DNA invertase Pin-like site-specific DNA recombinase